MVGTGLRLIYGSGLDSSATIGLGRQLGRLIPALYALLLTSTQKAGGR